LAVPKERAGSRDLVSYGLQGWVYHKSNS
jgi:hypothetical protein